MKRLSVIILSAISCQICICNPGDTLLSEYFEVEPILNWEFDMGWGVEDVDNNKVLRYSGNENRFARYNNTNDWNDYSFKSSIYIEQGGIEINYRLSETGRYLFHINPESLEVSRQVHWGGFTHLYSVPVNLDLNEWHTIEIIGMRDSIQILINQELIGCILDTAYLVSGGIGYLGGPNGRFMIDSIIVSKKDLILIPKRINYTTSGIVVQDEVWRDSILITGDIEIPKGVTLTIEPGTTIKFTAQSDDQLGGPNYDVANYDNPNDPPAIPSQMIGINVSGDLIVEGTPDNPICFTSNSDTPFLNDWQSISIFSDNQIVFDNVIIEYNYWGIQLSEKSDVIVRNSTIRHIATCGICTGSETEIQDTIIVYNNRFIDCNHEGIDTYKNQNFIIFNNLFRDNIGAGVIAWDNKIHIRDNVFSNNIHGILTSGAPIIHGNTFINNIENALQIHPRNPNSYLITEAPYLQYNNIIRDHIEANKKTLDAIHNFWGFTDTNEIDDLMHAVDTGSVNYIPFETTLIEFEPSKPNSPFPSDKALVLDTSQVNLHWKSFDANLDSLCFIVYFDTVNPPIRIIDTLENISKTTVMYLETSTWYYWMIGVEDSVHKVQGPVWEFETKNRTVYHSEEISICQGENYLGWDETGVYSRTLLYERVDSIISTTLIVNEAPKEPVISLNGNTLKTSTDANNNIQWYLNNEMIVNAHDSILTATESGIYLAEVTNEFGCAGLSQPVEVTIVDTKSDNNYIINIYPNPTHTSFIIQTVTSDLINLDIVSINGQLLFSQEMLGTTHQIDLTSFQKGVYYITIRSKDFVTTRKIIKL